jgi:hypothetical protein
LKLRVGVAPHDMPVLNIFGKAPVVILPRASQAMRSRAANKNYTQQPASAGHRGSFVALRFEGAR